jgi:Flp pilus assembly protein TadG
MFAALSSLNRSFRGLIGDRRGVAAVEFAFIAPLMLCMYFMTMEVSQGIETNKKIGRVGSMVADLITQQQKITKSEIDAIMRIAESIIQPYSRSTPNIIVTAIEVTDETTPQVKVVWSRRLFDGVYSRDANPGTATSVPESLKVKGSFLVRVESELSYRPVITWSASEKAALGLASAFDRIEMGKIYYMRPRMSTTIPCTDC